MHMHTKVLWLLYFFSWCTNSKGEWNLPMHTQYLTCLYSKSFPAFEIVFKIVSAHIGHSILGQYELKTIWKILPSPIVLHCVLTALHTCYLCSLAVPLWPLVQLPHLSKDNSSLRILYSKAATLSILFSRTWQPSSYDTILNVPPHFLTLPLSSLGAYRQCPPHPSISTWSITAAMTIWWLTYKPSAKLCVKLF